MMLLITIFILVVVLFFIGKIAYDARTYTKYFEKAASMTIKLDHDEEVVVEHLTMKEIDDLYKSGATSIERNGETRIIRNATWSPSTKDSRPD